MNQIFTALSILTLATITPSQDPTDMQQALVELATELAKEQEVPGVAMAMFGNGEIAWAEGIGVADAETGRVMTADTVLNVGSVSKCVAAWGFMQLVESDQVDLDAPISVSLTRWKLPESEFDADEVTLQRLLSHTAGLSLHGYPGFTNRETLPTLEESLSGATGGRGDVRLILPPGSQFKYSGGGTTMAQLMLEELTGEDFATYMRKHVFAPLKMDRSDYGWTERVMKKAAKPHGEQGEVLELEHFTALAAAGLQTTVLDMARFGLAALARNDVDTAGVLSLTTIKDMQEPVVTEDDKDPVTGLGYTIREIAGVQLVGHTGSNTGWEAAFFLYPSLNEGLVVLTNSERGQRVLRPVYGKWASSLRQREGK